MKEYSVEVEKSDQWQTIQATLSYESKIHHVRVRVPPGITSIKSIELNPQLKRL